MAYYRLDNMPKAIEAWAKAMELDPAAEHLKDMLERAKRRLNIKNRAGALKRKSAKDKPVGPRGLSSRRYTSCSWSLTRPSSNSKRS